MRSVVLLQIWILLQAFLHGFYLTTCGVAVASVQFLQGPAAESESFDFGIAASTRPGVLNATNSSGSSCTLWEALPCSAPVPPIGKFSRPWGPFWAPSAWGPCSQKCGSNGTQGAIIDCYSTGFLKVDASNCALLPLIQLNQPCNRVPCPIHEWYESQWGECTQPCDVGSQTRYESCMCNNAREVVCIDSLGNTADPAYCGGDDTVSEFQYCNMDHCSKPKWHGSDWSHCSKRCDGGVMTRQVHCLVNGSAVSDSSCFARDRIPSQRICNSQPCHPYTWLAGAWTNCSSVCGSNTTRLVQCVDDKGKVAPDVNCPAARPATTSPCPAALLNCSNCEYNNCSGNGYCPDGNRCLCAGEWKGRYCEKSDFCELYLGVMGFTSPGHVNCCATIDASYSCCQGAFAVLDKNGKCCESGSLDACGICDGTGIFVDSLLQCCSTVRDEKGVCCSSGLLDECYVCDGDGLSCGASFTLTLGFTTTLTMDFKSWQGFTSKMTNSVGSDLNLVMSAVTVSDMQVQNLNADCNVDPINCGQAGIFTGIATFVLNILPIARNASSRPLIRKADIVPRLVAISSTGSDEEDEILPGAEILSVTNVTRLGVCGNGLCEIGERCTVTGQSADTEVSPSCCVQDCPYVSTPCATRPGSGANVTCSGQGICMDTTGQCDCFLGYAGRDCAECLTGWQPSVFGGCLRVPNMSVMVQFNRQFKPPESGLTTGMVVILLGALGTCTYLLIKHQTAIVQLQPGAPAGLVGPSGHVPPPPGMDVHQEEKHEDQHEDHTEQYVQSRPRWRQSYLGKQSDYDVIPITPRPPSLSKPSPPSALEMKPVLSESTETIAGAITKATSAAAQRLKASGMEKKRAVEEQKRKDQDEQKRRDSEAQRLRRESEQRQRDEEARDQREEKLGQERQRDEHARKELELQRHKGNTHAKQEEGQVIRRPLNTWEHEQTERDEEVRATADRKKQSLENEVQRRLSWKQLEDERDEEMRKDVERRRASREMERNSLEMQAAPQLRSRPSIIVPNDDSEVEMAAVSSTSQAANLPSYEESHKLNRKKSFTSQPVQKPGDFLTDSDSDTEPEEKLHFNDLVF